MPIKIAREDLKVTMLDSLQKRLTFLKEVNDQLGLDCTFIDVYKRQIWKAVRKSKIKKFHMKHFVATDGKTAFAAGRTEI